MKKEVMKEILSGNGSQFTIKEILSEHIKVTREFEKCILEKFEKGSGKIAINTTNISSLWKVLKYGAIPIIGTIFSWLIMLTKTVK